MHSGIKSVHFLLSVTLVLTKSVFTLTIAVGVQDKPEAAPAGPWKSDYKLVGNPSFTEAISALSSMVFAYAGTPAFFSIISEMREPKHYTKSLIICQTTVTVTYTVIGIVVYYYCGSFVASPALGSAGHMLKKVCYGIAIPGLLVSTLILLHVSSSSDSPQPKANNIQLPAKYIFLRLMKGTKHLTDNTFTHWIVWFSCVLGSTVIAWLIASVIPVFGGLVSLVGALLGTLMAFQPMGCMWLYDNWHRGKTNRTTGWMIGVAWSVFVIASGTFLMIGGTYGSIVGIIDEYKASGGSSAFSCADNSNSAGRG